jgi:hypothetical protein
MLVHGKLLEEEYLEMKICHKSHLRVEHGNLSMDI